MMYVSPVVNNEVLNSKKVHLESNTMQVMPVSRVLHLRRLPTDVTESEVATLAIPFGPISNMVLTKKTGQALIELASTDIAIAMVQYYSGVCPPSIRGTSQVIVQYSKYTALTTPGASQHISEAILTANKQIAANAVETAQSGGQKTVIRIQVERSPPQVQLNYVIFYKIFRNFGDILRIIVFKSAQTPQALVEFKSALSAHVAKLQTNSVPLFPNGAFSSGVMRVDFSRQGQLEVRRENDNCRDFTLNPLTDQEFSSMQLVPNGSYYLERSPLNGNIMLGHGSHPSTMRAAQYLSATAGVGSLLDKQGNVDSLTLAAVAGRVIQPLLSAAAGRSAGQLDAAILHQQLAALQQLTSHGMTEGGMPGVDVPHHYQSAGMQPGILQNTSLSAMMMNANRPTGVMCMVAPSPAVNASSVVIVSGLDVGRVTPDKLFILFGVYGDVQRVKIMYSKKDTALVQYTDACQAASAVSNLNGASLYGNTIRCNFSKHFNIKMPQSTNEDSPEANGTSGAGDTGTAIAERGSTTRDYCNHRLHRFKRANSRNHQNIYPPSCVLHVSNLPDSTSESELSHIFETVTGSSVIKCKMMMNEKKMALVQFESIDKAIGALIDMHDYQMTEYCRIRVSFSKSLIRN